ncbi:uncharacterized protein LOC111713991 [Eurytemora carolleeae]|uniref:uncharacterized protein LOC111713991 n=1 Tax=Eurytemora carolleeae TaxID=1294199 RepID=UPI000C78389A|nr:uncharacterized protein LOC111713991 [Eurytemora carolleeae]|eukprot:XP_023344759.1 uncharacterized protein LOC111713991 [Eurytemora affinis]
MFLRSRTLLLVPTLLWALEIAGAQSVREDHSKQPLDERPQRPPVSPYLLYGPHGYRTYPHSICQEVPTVEVSMSEMEGDWFLIEYVNSHDGKPIGAHTPYLCPEARMTFDPVLGEPKLNISQISYEWPALFVDTVEWVQHRNKTGVFFHEENIFSLWTLKVLEFDAESHMVFFLCIDYTIWPGWNHRGVYVLSRTPELKNKVRRQLSNKAHKRMRMNYDRRVNTTSCNPDDWLPSARPRWHPHKKINNELYRAPVHPYISRKHRRNLNILD